MDGAIEESDRQFEIPGTAQVVEGNGGLTKVRITAPEVVGEMYLHGAHVTSWKRAGGEEVLFLSSQSRWEDDREAYQSASPGLGTRLTIPRRRHTGSYARWLGSLSR